MKTGTLVLKQNRFALYISRKSNLLIEIISALFILLFVYTGINKFLFIDLLKFTLKDYPFVGHIPVVTAWGMPIIELTIALLLFIPKFRQWGLYASTVLMVSFTFYVAYMFAFTPKLPCTCGGMLHQLSWPQHLAFNIFFSLIGIAGILLERNKRKNRTA